MVNIEGEKRPERRDFEAALASGGDLGAFLEGAHLADVAEWLLEVEEEDARRVFERLDLDGQVELLSYADESIQVHLLEGLAVDEAAGIVALLPADEAVDLLALLDDERSESILRHVDLERSRGLRELAAFDADTAGGLMTTDFLAAGEDTRVGDVIKDIKSEDGPANDEEVGVFVVDVDGRPTGWVSDRDLLTHGIHTRIGDAMETDLISVPAGEDQEEVAHLLLKYDLSAVPVVDARGVLIGVVSSDDVLEVLEEEAEEDIRRLVGTSTDDQTRLPVFARVRTRLPLQGLTVLGGLVTAAILDWAMPSTESGGMADLLRYLPIIIGLAGNVGIQSSTILVRAFATGEVTEEREVAVMRSEVLVGFTIGVLCGATTALIAPWLEGGTEVASGFGIAIGIAICIAVAWASVLGCAVPIVCRRLGIDPAVVAGPFLITLSDISGATIFVGVAKLLLTAFGST